MLEDWKITQIIETLFINNMWLGYYGLDTPVADELRQAIYKLDDERQRELFAEVVGF